MRAMYYILKDRVPIAVFDVMEWAFWYEDADRIVRQTELPDGVRISTIFLGLDHRIIYGPPQIFETMIFEKGKSYVYDRYATWKDAERGHIEAIEKQFEVEAKPQAK